MNLHKTEPNIWQFLFAALAITLALSLLAACGASQEQLVAPQAVVILTETAVISTYTPNEKEALDTRIAATRNARRTVVALPGVPTGTVGPPPTHPTYTPVLGMLGTEPDFSKNPANPRITSIWRGWIGGGIVQVNAGSEGEARDPLQGIIIVDVWSTGSSDTYNTPQRVGPVRIVAVDGMRVTLTPVDLGTPGVLVTPWATQTPGVLFVFDLATRQWVNP